MGNFDQFWAETIADAEPPRPRPAATVTLDRPSPPVLPAPREATPPPTPTPTTMAFQRPHPPASVPRPAGALPPGSVLPASLLPASSVSAQRSPRGARRLGAAALTAAVAAAVVIGALSLGVGPRSSTPPVQAGLPRAAGGAVSAPAGRWSGALDGLGESVRSAGLQGVVTATYAAKRTPSPVLVAAGRGRLDGAFQQVASGLAGPDGAVGISAPYVVDRVAVRCGDVTATGRAGVLCVWSGGAAWAPGATRIGDVASFAAKLASAGD